MTKQKNNASTSQTTTHIDGDFEGEIIQGNNNIIDKSIFKGEEISQSLQDVSNTLNDAMEGPRWEHYSYEAEKSESREILETIFVSAVSGLIIGIVWPSIGPWLSLSAYPIVLLTTTMLSVLRITHFGVRHTFVLSGLAGIAFYIWIEYGVGFTIIESLVSTVPVMGILLNGMIGAFIGLVIGIVLMFWRPLNF